MSQIYSHVWGLIICIYNMFVDTPAFQKCEKKKKALVGLEAVV